MGLLRNDDDDDDDEKKPWTHSCFELSLGHHLPNYWRGAPACVCVCAIITTFSKHLRPPGPVFIAGNRDGPTLVRRTISAYGREKNEGRRMTRKGCSEGQRARSLTDWPIQSVCVAPEMRAGFLWGKRPPETGIRTCFPDRISQLGKSEKHTESILKFSQVDWKLLNKIFRRRCILIIFPGQTRSRFFSLLSSTLFEHCQMYSALIPAKDGDVTKAQMMCMFVCVSAIERWSKISRIWRIM